MMLLDNVNSALATSGLASRGAFHPDPDDGVPPIGAGTPVRTLVLAGNAGRGMWASFSSDSDATGEPLDEWSKQILTDLAAKLDAVAFFPFSRPYLPFQRWATRAEPCHVSPLGILIHPDYGLWHGYRGALGFAERLDLLPADERASPCDTCIEKPCLGACPAGAFDGVGYDVPACVAHLKSSAGQDCLDRGCRARRACPVGRDYVYNSPQARFHMAAFLRRHSGKGGGSARAKGNDRQG